MTHSRNLFSVLIILLDWQSRQTSGTLTESWNSLFLVCAGLAKVKRIAKENMELAWNHSTHSPKDRPWKGTTSPRNPYTSLSSLPTEIILKILSMVNNQQVLSNVSRLNGRFYRLSTALLYQIPRLTSPTSINNFMASISEMPLSNRSFVKTLVFAPTKTGSLSHPTKRNSRFEMIPYVHSGLFLLLIQNRDLIGRDRILVHPIFYHLARLFPFCISYQEHGCHKESKTQLAETYSKGAVPEISKIPSSSITLSFLIRSCQRWHTDFQEWNGLKDDIIGCFDTVILILDWLQGNFHPIWHRLGGDLIRRIKPIIHNRCRTLLAHLNASLLLQVRFITSNSQRLLDCYCLIFYRVLSMAQALSVQALADIMESDKQKELSLNQIAASQIYEALAIIFQLRIPAEVINSNGRGNLDIPVQILQDILVTFPPSSINAETAELIGQLLEIKLDYEASSTPQLQEWMKWFDEINHWHDASIEMEPVKDLLRKSMAKIDQLRGIQRRYGVVFMNE
jgi:hypothetical protein